MRLFSLLILVPHAYAQISLFGEYSEQRAKQALNIAAAAYSNDPAKCLESTFPHKHYRIVAEKELACDSKGNLCYVFVSVSHVDQTILVSFRGTNSAKQLKLEFVESLKPSIDWYGFGLVDRYFYNALNHLWPAIEPSLTDLGTSTYRVFFTGHSLGGALATLAALKAYKEHAKSPYQLHLFTFGEPRVGNKILANNVDRIIVNSWRIVHAADIVPHLPPCKDSPTNGKACDSHALSRGYHHGTEIWYKHGMGPGSNYKVCTIDDEDPNCSNSLGKYKIKDHYYYFDVMVSSHGENGCQESSGLFNLFKTSSSRSLTLVLFVLVFLLE